MLARHPQLRLVLGSRARRLVSAAALRAPMVLTRAQASAARSTAEVAGPVITLVTAGTILAPLVLTRAQADGARSTAEVAGG